MRDNVGMGSAIRRLRGVRTVSLPENIEPSRHLRGLQCDEEYFIALLMADCLHPGP